MTTGYNILTLVEGQQLSIFTPDDILDPYITQTIYLSQGSATFASPISLLFTRPDNKNFLIQAPDATRGSGDVITPKGTFLSGTYIVYNIPFDKFTMVGVWGLNSSISKEGGSFEVGALNFLYLQAETGETMYTENDQPIFIEFS